MPYANAMKAIRRYWDERAQAYSERRKRRGWKREIDEMVSALLDVDSNHIVLEIGAGPGFFAIHLAKERKPIIVGLYFSKQFLNIAKEDVKRTNVSDRVFLILGIADFLPLKVSSFDAAVEVHTIHHLPPPRIEESFREIHRVLRDGGRFVLSEGWAFEPRNEFQRIMLELRRWLYSVKVEEWHLKYSEYIAMLEKAGLRTYNVQFHPNKVPLSRFECIPNEKARKLLQKAKQFDAKERFVDVNVISSAKPKLKQS